MKANTKPMHLGGIYHMYNRGINGESLFRNKENYQLFLEKYAKHIHPVAKTYAYSLMGNHFHLLLEIRTMEEIREHFLRAGQTENYQRKFSSEDRILKFVSSQFAHLFNGYTQVINHAFSRTGGLFEETFRRIHVDSDAYFSSVAIYIHLNPQLHGFTNDFRDYSYSSFQSHISDKPTHLERDKILEWFGGKDEFIKAHQFRATGRLDIEW